MLVARVSSPSPRGSPRRDHRRGGRSVTSGVHRWTGERVTRRSECRCAGRGPVCRACVAHTETGVPPRSGGHVAHGRPSRSFPGEGLSSKVSSTRGGACRKCGDPSAAFSGALAYALLMGRCPQASCVGRSRSGGSTPHRVDSPTPLPRLELRLSERGSRSPGHCPPLVQLWAARALRARCRGHAWVRSHVAQRRAVFLGVCSSITGLRSLHRFPRTTRAHRVDLCLN